MPKLFFNQSPPISLVDSGMVNFPKLRNVERGGDLGSFRGIGGYEQ